MEKLNFEILHKYKLLLDEIKAESNQLLEDTLKVNDNTFEVIANMGGIFYGRRAKCMNLHQRMRGSSELREIFTFTAMLYFDYKAHEVTDYLNVSRAMAYHYCQKVIDKFLLYNDYRENCLRFFSFQEMMDMILKFSAIKRK